MKFADDTKIYQKVDSDEAINRVSVGIFATAGVFATIKCVIYGDVHILCMFSSAFADIGLPPFWYIIGFHLIFVVTISKVLKYAMLM